MSRRNIPLSFVPKGGKRGQGAVTTALFLIDERINRLIQKQ